MRRGTLFQTNKNHFIFIFFSFCFYQWLFSPARRPFVRVAGRRLPFVLVMVSLLNMISQRVSRVSNARCRRLIDVDSIVVFLSSVTMPRRAVDDSWRNDSDVSLLLWLRLCVVYRQRNSSPASGEKSPQSRFGRQLTSCKLVFVVCAFDRNVVVPTVVFGRADIACRRLTNCLERTRNPSGLPPRRRPSSRRSRKDRNDSRCRRVRRLRRHQQQLGALPA